jgi:hypothetical protein
MVEPFVGVSIYRQRYDYARRITLKTRNVIVPRMLVAYHLLHPEDYGESIVVLKNGMFTDVYTNQKGCLFTITNDQLLTKYLQSNQVEDIIIELRNDTIHLRSICLQDANRLLEWMNQASPYQYDLNHVQTFISHSLTLNSHVLMVFVNNLSVGYIGYTTVQPNTIINLEIYDHDNINDCEFDKMLTLFLGYVSKQSDKSSLLIEVNQSDLDNIERLKRNRFTINHDMTPSSSDAVVYQYIHKD